MPARALAEEKGKSTMTTRARALLGTLVMLGGFALSALPARAIPAPTCNLEPGIGLSVAGSNLIGTGSATNTCSSEAADVGAGVTVHTTPVQITPGADAENNSNATTAFASAQSVGFLVVGQNCVLVNAVGWAAGVQVLPYAPLQACIWVDPTR